MVDTVPQGQRLVVWRRTSHRVKPNRKRGLRTICEVLRELYREAQQREDTLAMARLEEATDMAKRMQARLTYYAQGNVTLCSTEQGMVWVIKASMIKLTPEELQLIQQARSTTG